MTEEFRIVIPARMASQRLPGKPLAQIAGQSLLHRVYQCAQLSAAESVVIATDNDRIAEHAHSFSDHVVMTRTDHESGSDRIAEVANVLEWPDQTIIVNLQGDEPLMPAACLNQVAGLLASDETADMASLYWPIESRREAEDPNVVKVVVAETGNALFFSRSLLPFPRDPGPFSAPEGSSSPWLRHVGLYAYRAGALKRFSRLAPTPLERMEKLEQLRVLETGGRIAMALACGFIPPGVDTEEDLKRVERQIVISIK